MPAAPALLFTAFEPSGDDHASAVIAELRARHPDLPIYAWGGPKMERAGATLIALTGRDAVMGLPGLRKIQEHRRINADVAAWMDRNPVTLHIPVDSPAANFPICAIAKARGAKVVHLVAPQIWAWGRWRIHKLRRLTDLVLCLLPFEERFFRRRNVPARFVGHPLFDRPVDEAELARRAAAFADGSPRLALMPGSRPAEIHKNFPLLLEVFRRLKAEHPAMTGMIATTGPDVEARLREMAAALGGWPEGLHTAISQTDAVIHWCEAALVVSGTVSLQVAKQCRPMVVFYKSSPLLYFGLAKWIVATKFYALPNLVAERRIIPELVPHFGGAEPIYRAASALIGSPEALRRQREDLAAMVERFAGLNAASAAADAIEEVAGLRPATSARTAAVAAAS